MKRAGHEAAKESDEKAFECLKGAELFSSLAEEELRAVAASSTMLELGAGDALFEPGSPGDALYAVASGSIGVEGSDGRIIAEFVAGDILGDLDLFTGAARNARAKALEPCVLAKFPAASGGLDAALSTMPSLAARLLRDFLKTVSARIRGANALIKENSPWVQELRRQVYGDKLTGLYNRTYLEENLPGLLSDAGRPAALVLLKPDNFKLINDTYGHEAGDAALVLMAAELRRVVGDSGTCVKYEGNEIGAMLPSAGREQAKAVAERARAAFKALDVSSATGGEPVMLTVSAGVAVYPEHGADAAAIIAAAHALPLKGRSRGGDAVLFPEDA